MDTDRTNTETSSDESPIASASAGTVSERICSNKVDKAAMARWVEFMAFTEAPLGIFVHQSLLYHMFREYCPAENRLSDPPTEFDRSMFARHLGWELTLRGFRRAGKAQESLTGDQASFKMLRRWGELYGLESHQIQESDVQRLHPTATPEEREQRREIRREMRERDRAKHKALMEQRSSQQSEHLELEKVSFRYMDEFVRDLGCAPELLRLKVFPNAKELAEAMAAFNAVRRHLTMFSLSDPSVSMIAVGDGSTPRTSVMFHFRSKWTCYSIDPAMSTQDIERWSELDRVVILPKKIEEVSIRVDKAVLICMHTHVDLPIILDSIECKQLAIVACPCCNYEERLSLRDRAPDIQYDDTAMPTPKRNIRIYLPRSVEQGSSTSTSTTGAVTLTQPE